MESLRIDIVNPKAKKIIKELADLNLITITRLEPVKSFQQLLNKLRVRKNTISIETVSKEAELVRSKRDGKKA